MYIKYLALCISTMLLTSCASPYQPSGFGGGYTDMALSRDTYHITFRGNGFTSSDTVQSYLLRRSAELTLQKGYKYFVILNGGTTVDSQIIQTPATINTNSYGNFQGYGSGTTSLFGNQAYSNYNFGGSGSSNSYTSITPGNQYQINKFKSGATIKLLHSSKGYPQAYEASIIMSNYNSQN